MKKTSGTCFAGLLSYLFFDLAELKVKACLSSCSFSDAKHFEPVYVLDTVKVYSNIQTSTTTYFWNMFFTRDKNNDVHVYAFIPAGAVLNLLLQAEKTQFIPPSFPWIRSDTDLYGVVGTFFLRVKLKLNGATHGAEMYLWQRMYVCNQMFLCGS